MGDVRGGNRMWAGLLGAVESTQVTVADPGVGATVAAPSHALLVVAWIVGIIALAILWAASRR